jgi:hypothetical protein
MEAFTASLSAGRVYDELLMAHAFQHAKDPWAARSSLKAALAAFDRLSSEMAVVRAMAERIEREAA